MELTDLVDLIDQQTHQIELAHLTELVLQIDLAHLIDNSILIELEDLITQVEISGKEVQLDKEI